MPHSRNRAQYPAVTALLAVLVGIWFLVYASRGLIPPGPPNRLATETTDYLQSGSTQPIPWWPIGSEALAESRRLNKPILLMISAAWSEAGREIDRNTLDDRDVVDRMSQDFICIRVDLAERPEWASAFLPVRRAILGFEPSFQIWFLDPDLRVFGMALHENPEQRLDVAFMITSLRSARTRWLDMQSGGTAAIQPGADQRQDHILLTESPELPKIDFDKELQSIANGASSFGGFPVNLFQKPRPNVYRYLWLRGETEILTRTLDPILTTPIVDLLDGGFFRVADGEDWFHPEFDKLARTNADMMALLATVYSRRRDPLYRYLAERTFECLTEGFADDEGLIRSYRLGDEQEDGRSRRSSFSVAFLQHGSGFDFDFNADERQWLTHNLGLDPHTNPLMVPYLTSSKVVELRPELDQYLSKLREARADVNPVYGSSLILDVNGFVAARLLEAGRILGDAKIMDSGAALRLRIRRFRVGPNDVIRSIKGDMFSARSLTDYLAYADAAIQDYMAFGDPVGLLDGAGVLERAVELYTDDESGLLDESFFDYLHPVPPDVRGPQVCDDFIESSSAMAIRLLYQYSCALPASARGRKFREIASRLVRRLAPAAALMGTRSSAFYCAAWRLQQDRLAVTVGPADVELARKVSALAPMTAFIGAARDIVYPELKKRGPGVYVIRNGKTAGPLSVEEAATRLNDLMQ